MKLLVAYASKHGSTAEIAGAIGKTLEAQGPEVDVLDVGDVNNLMDYDAVVLGSAVYSQQWMAAATQFLTMRKDILATKPVWLFSSGPTGHGEAVDLLGGFTFPEKLKPIVEVIKPQDIVVFHGHLDLTRLTLAELMIVKGYGGPLGDYRQWDTIQRWALNIAQYMTKTYVDTTASA
jgi:menaquinone-dependent protoporphyrinogen oxidase